MLILYMVFTRGFLRMKTLDKEQDKVQKICDTLRKQTLEPAQADARNIIIEAKAHAEEIVREAHRQADQLLADARQAIAREKSVFESSLSQAAKQSLEALRQAIETELFNPELHNLTVRGTTDPAVIASLINSICKAIEKEGLASDLSTLIPASVSAQQINSMIAKEVLSKLKEKSVQLGDFSGGAKVCLEGKNITLDMSNEAIEDLLQRYVRKDFRKMLFGKSH